MNIKILGYFVIPALLAGVTGCYPEHSDPDELDIVLTNYDSTYDFDGIQTYIMPDTVIAVTDPDDPSNTVTYGHLFDSLLLAKVAEKFDALGYQRVFDTVPEKPDVAVLLNVSATKYWSVYWYDWYDYWGWYDYWPYYYDDGDAYSFPWVITYDYTVGSLIVQMTDLKPPAGFSPDSLSVVWIGVVNGLVEGSDVPARISGGIDQMFIQSPYL